MNLHLSNFPNVETLTQAHDRDAALRAALTRLLAEQEFEVAGGAMGVEIRSLNAYFTDRALEDGAAHWHVDQAFHLRDIEGGDFDLMLPHCDEHGGHPVILHKAQHTTHREIRDRRRDDDSGPGYREVEISVSEELVVHVLSMTLDGDAGERHAIVHVRGEGSYSL